MSKRQEKRLKKRLLDQLDRKNAFGVTDLTPYNATRRDIVYK